MNGLGIDMGHTEHPLGVTPLIGQDHGDHVAGPAGPGRAPGTVQEGLGVRRRIHLDHQVHITDIDASGGHVGGHQDTDITLGEGLQVAVTLVLGKIAVQLGCRDPVGDQVLGQLLGLELGTGEEDALSLAGGQTADQVMLGILGGLEDVVGHLIHMLGG